MRASPLPRQCRNENGKPKFRYDTRAEAKAAARTIANPTRIYRCGYCSYFHLATRAASPAVAASGRGCSPVTGAVTGADRSTGHDSRPGCTPGDRRETASADDARREHGMSETRPTLRCCGGYREHFDECAIGRQIDAARWSVARAEVRGRRRRDDATYSAAVGAGARYMEAGPR